MKKSIKRALTLVTAIAMLVSVLGVFGCLDANAASTKFVKLYSAEITSDSDAYESRIIYVRTDGNSSNQSVTVHYNYLSNTWKDAAATYVKTLSDGSKIWKACYSTYRCAGKYAIKYVANGTTLWDNNNGQDYYHEVIGDAPVAVQRGYDYKKVTAVLQNYAYEKNVYVKYTTNNWKTSKTAKMSYQSTNSNGTENWYVDLSKVSKDFKFSVYYKVNGKTYVADNFGKYYDRDYITEHFGY